MGINRFVIGTLLQTIGFLILVSSSIYLVIRDGLSLSTILVSIGTLLMLIYIILDVKKKGFYGEKI